MKCSRVPKSLLLTICYLPSLTNLTKMNAVLTTSILLVSIFVTPLSKLAKFAENLDS